LLKHMSYPREYALSAAQRQSIRLVSVHRA